MDTESVREDIGYVREVGPMGKARFVVKKRIRYLREPMKGQTGEIKAEIADDLIAHGMAEEIGEREAGEEG